MRCPSSVRPSQTFHIFDFSSETAKLNSTKLDRKQDLNVLYKVCVSWADWRIKMAALASDWLRHFWLLLWNCWTEFNETWQEARSKCPLQSLCFSGRSEKTRWPPWPLIGWDIFDFSSELLNRTEWNLAGSKISTSSTKFVFFELIGKTRWPPWPLIGWDSLDFSSETAERNSTKLDRKQDLNVLYQVCVFLGRSEKQDGRPGLWLAETFSTSPMKPLNRIQRNLTGWPWPLIGWDLFSAPEPKAQVHYCDHALSVVRPSLNFSHFQFLLWNHWTEFNETWQEARF